MGMAKKVGMAQEYHENVVECPECGDKWWSFEGLEATCNTCDHTMEVEL